MTIGEHNEIGATDINVIANKISAECTRRGVSKTSSTVSQGDFIKYTDFTTMANDIQTIEVVHCYCEAHGNMETHSGCTSYTFTPSSDVDDFAVDYPYSAERIGYLSSDIISLEGHCACDDFCTCDTLCDCDNVCCNTVCTCEQECETENTCDCDSGNCTCVGNCTCDTNCTCNTLCGCDTVCTCFCVCPCENVSGCGCDVDEDLFGCTCETQPLCPTNSDYCSCNEHCICDNECTCDVQCTCDEDTVIWCDCELECSCDDVCNCEFND